MNPVREAVVILAKAPIPGRVKTRLAAALGDARAAALYRAFGQDLLANLATVVDLAQIRVQVDPSDDAAMTLVREWLGPGPVLAPQRDADLGGRMAQALGEAFQTGAERAVLVGSDLPDLDPALVRQALDLLADPAGPGSVLGPAGDGGYYLIGFARIAFAPQVLAGLAWSTPGVYSEQVRGLVRHMGRAPAVISPWQDVDDLIDLRALARRLAAHPERAPRTFRLLAGGSESCKGSA